MSPQAQSASAANFSGVISGAGGIELQSGALALSGINTYAGGTTIDSGATLNLSGAITSNIADNGALIVNRPGALTLGGVISGNGVFNQAGSGTTTLLSINSFTGTTHVNAGTLNVTGSLTGSLTTNS